ncbi:sulfatase [Verrucomicrobia bacterium]|nr:sulfatase [Verrucomicrobiota bacterium]
MDSVEMDIEERSHALHWAQSGNGDSGCDPERLSPYRWLMNVSKRTLPVVLIFLVFGNLSAAGKPNIVFIMADDLGWADVGFNGAKFYETPHIDRLRAGGMNFTSAYPGASNCMPSRSCIMTGMYTPRTQMWTPGSQSKGEISYMKFSVPTKGSPNGKNDIPSKGALEPSVTSIAETLKLGGYRSARFGKWHLGPDTQGFDISDPSGRGGKIGNKLYGNIDVAEWLTDASVKFIEDSKDSPFFLYLTHWDVHTPIKARKDVVEKYQRKLDGSKWGREWNVTYAAMIEAVDTSVGRVREALEKNGVAENTLFIFTSDNGGHSGVTWCDPLKGAKGAFYEGGIRVPACARWPGVIEANSECDTPITGVDYLPTFAALAGVKPLNNQPVDGRSFVPLLKGESALKDRAVFWHYPLYLSGGGYNQVVPVHGTDRMYWRATPCSVIRKGDWKLIQFFESDSIQLFNLKRDVGEQSDLAKEEPVKAVEMLTELQAWQKATGAPIPKKLNPLFDSTKVTVKKGNGKRSKKKSVTKDK